MYHLRTFGCVAHVKKLGRGLHKLADRSVPSIFIGYEEGAKAYQVYDPVGKRLYTTRDVVFEERRAWDWITQHTTEGNAEPPNFTVVYTTAENYAEDDGGGDSHVHGSPCARSPPIDPAMDTSVTASSQDEADTAPVGKATKAPRPPPPQPTHNMVTRAQNGVFRPHPRYAQLAMSDKGSE